MIFNNTTAAQLVGNHWHGKEHHVIGGAKPLECRIEIVPGVQQTQQQQQQQEHSFPPSPPCPPRLDATTTSTENQQQTRCGGLIHRHRPVFALIFFLSIQPLGRLMAGYSSKKVRRSLLSRFRVPGLQGFRAPGLVALEPPNLKLSHPQGLNVFELGIESSKFQG